MKLYDMESPSDDILTVLKSIAELNKKVVKHSIDGK